MMHAHSAEKRYFTPLSFSVTTVCLSFHCQCEIILPIEMTKSAKPDIGYRHDRSKRGGCRYCMRQRIVYNAKNFADAVDGDSDCLLLIAAG